MSFKHLTEYNTLIKLRSGIMLYISHANSTFINRLKPWCGGVPSEVMFNVIRYTHM